MTRRRESARTLAVATVAMTPDLDPRISRERIQRMVEETKCAHPDVRLILFGETILGWFYKPGETQAYHDAIAEPIPGPSTQFVAQLAKQHDVYISFGLSERADGKLYNSQVLLSPQGDILAKHRKFWIRNKAFTAGDSRLTTAEVDGVKVALVICADARSISLLRAIRRQRVDVVLASLADYATDIRLNQIMGSFYDAWTLIANRFSEEPPITWPGLITITDPWARLHASGMGKEQALFQRIAVSRPGSLARHLRRDLIALKLVGLATLMAGRLAWKAVAKPRKKETDSKKSS